MKQTTIFIVSSIDHGVWSYSQCPSRTKIQGWMEGALGAHVHSKCRRELGCCAWRVFWKREWCIQIIVCAIGVGSVPRHFLH